MNVGLIGLGKMGSAIAQRLSNAGHTVFGYDPGFDARKQAREHGVTIVDSVADIAKHVHVVWLMVPAGEIVDSVLGELLPHLKEGDIVIDGGNSKFSNSLVRYKMLQDYGVQFLDCGTSGGVHGLNHGFCLMVGGQEAAYRSVFQLFKAVAAPGGCELVGGPGAGHYVKMVHNGIEYALLEAYAEGLQVIKEGSYKKSNLDLEKITGLWNSSSVIRSFLLELTHGVYKKNPSFKDISGEVAHTGMGAWTIEESEKNKIPVPAIKVSLEVREWSQETGGNYATKLIALLRNAFGGHAVKKLEK